MINTFLSMRFPAGPHQSISAKYALYKGFVYVFFSAKTQLFLLADGLRNFDNCNFFHILAKLWLAVELSKALNQHVCFALIAHEPWTSPLSGVLAE